VNARAPSQRKAPAAVRRRRKLWAVARGYKVVYVGSHHPLASKSGHVFRHRLRLYNKIGPGTHACTWCSGPVTWGAQGPDALHVDHLIDRHNDDVSNLVPAHGSCNRKRANGTLYIYLRKKATWKPTASASKPPGCWAT
jgi:5-methylcytosine-specific restriction endonuclease McrA